MDMSTGEDFFQATHRLAVLKANDEGYQYFTSTDKQRLVGILAKNGPSAFAGSCIKRNPQELFDREPSVDPQRELPDNSMTVIQHGLAEVGVEK
jgi:hypothetical protein